VVTKVSAAWLLGLYEEGPRPAERDEDLRKYTARDLNPEPTEYTYPQVTGSGDDDIDGPSRPPFRRHLRIVA